MVLVDDHPCAREGVRAWLEAEGDFAVLAEAGEGVEAVRVVQQLQPDLVVLDLILPPRSGLDVLRELRQIARRVVVVIFTGSTSVADAYQAVRLGVDGYVVKEASFAELVTAMRHALAGRRYLQPRIAAQLAEREQAAARLGLTGRELEVLPLIADRWPNKEIARRLGCSDRMVEEHVTHLLAKLGVASRADVARQARAEGLLP